MNGIKHKWRQLPVHIRKPVVFAVGMLFIILAGLTGWLPGPGGIPFFLIGIAILSTEFEWAARLKNKVLDWIHIAGTHYRKHKVIGTILAIFLACCVISLSIAAYAYFR